MGMTGKETSNFYKTMSCFSGSVAVLNISSSLKCPGLISKTLILFQYEIVRARERYIQILIYCYLDVSFLIKLAQLTRHLKGSPGRDC